MFLFLDLSYGCFSMKNDLLSHPWLIWLFETARTDTSSAITLMTLMTTSVIAGVAQGFSILVQTMTCSTKPPMPLKMLTRSS